MANTSGGNIPHAVARALEGQEDAPQGSQGSPLHGRPPRPSTPSTAPASNRGTPPRELPNIYPPGPLFGNLPPSIGSSLHCTPHGSIHGSPRSTSPTNPPQSKGLLGYIGFPSRPGSRSASRSASRRGSQNDLSSRRTSQTSKIAEIKKSVKSAVDSTKDSTKKAGHKVFDSRKQWKDDVEATRQKVFDSGKQLKDDVEATGKKVKDKTAAAAAHMHGVTAGASQWARGLSTKTAKAAMEQAKGGLSGGEKFTLYATEKISALSKKGFTHVFMFLVLILYTALGALLFIACEAPHETAEKLAIEKERKELIEGIWRSAKQTSEFGEFNKLTKNMLTPYEDQLYQSFSHGVSSDTEDYVWTFWKAMFYCSTITTTIGYGHITPKTVAGRGLTIFYAIIGIPIFLILMADFGKLFTRLLKSIFIFLHKVNNSPTCMRFKSSSPYKRVTGLFRSMMDIICCRKRKPQTPDEEKAEKKGSVDIMLLAADDFDLPISLAMVILLVYIFLGCILYTRWENWSFFEAFYFIFVSLTTIGFGDFVPEHPAFMMVTSFYLVFGLAITAMCINIIQEKLTNTFRQASVKLKERFSAIMAATAMDEMEKEKQDESAEEKTADNSIDEVGEVNDVRV